MIPLSCPHCGGTAARDDAALRRGYASCSRCSSILPLRPKAAPSPNLGPPPNLQITRRADRIFIRARKMKNSIFITRIELGIGLAAGVITFGLSGSTWLFLLAVILISLVLGGLRRWTPALILTPATLQASRQLLPLALPRDQIRQIYTAVVAVAVPNPEDIININLWALTPDNRRVHILGPLEDAAAALYAEEILELELGLRQRAVLGDASLEVAADGAIRPKTEPTEVPSAVESLACVTCGATSRVTEKDHLRGYSQCVYCESLTLLFDPEEKDILGLGDAAPVADRYTIEQAGGACDILAAGVPRISRQIDGTLVWGASGADSVAPQQVQAIAVRALGAAWGQGWSKLQERMAYSGQVNMAATFADGVASQFVVEVHLRDGTRLSVADDIPSAFEAFRIARALRT